MSAQAAVKYYDNGLKRSDYYTKEMGIWGGLGAEMLGLKGEVQRKHFVDLAENRLPGVKERLTQRTNTTRTVEKNGQKVEVENRRAGYDLTFSVPKSVSVYLAMNNDREVERIILEALDRTMREIEARMETKVRKGYKYGNRASGNLVYAKFIHRETRVMDGMVAPDPHYHVHVYTFNATFDQQEKEWKALEMGNTHGDRAFFEALFHAEVAQGLIDHGIDMRRTEEDFELASVSRELVDKFSKRTRNIEKYARENHVKLSARAALIMKQTGMTYDDAMAQAKAEIGGSTRKAKATDTLSPEQQRAQWASEMTAADLESIRPEAVRGKGNQNLIDVEMAEGLSVDHLFARRSLQRQLHAAGMLLRRGIGKVRLRDALRFMESEWFVQIGRLVTTRDVLKDERAMIRIAMDGQGGIRGAWKRRGVDYTGRQDRGRRVSEGGDKTPSGIP